MTGLFVPAAGLMLAAVLVPLALARVLPEGVTWLLVNGAVSATILLCASAGYFLWAYGQQDARVTELIGRSPSAGLWHFLRLGLLAGLIWAPVLVLSLSALPRRWKVATW